jgi:hypothetical protein
MGYIPTIKFNNISGNGIDLETIIAGLKMEQVKSVVFEKFIPNIEQAIKKNKKDCVFCYVNEEYQILINENDYGNVLNIVEEYYISKENYEVCAKIKQLKDAIKERRY